MYFIFEMFYTTKTKNPDLVVICKITDEREKYILKNSMVKVYSFSRYNCFISGDVAEYRRHSFARQIDESSADGWMYNF